MDQLPDLTQLTLVQLLSTLLFFAALDTLSAYIIAFINHNFQAAYALDFLRTHVLKVGGPIALLGIAGTGVPSFVPPRPFAFAAAVASLVGYVGVTIISIRDTFADKAIPPTPTVNIAPVVEPTV